MGEASITTIGGNGLSSLLFSLFIEILKLGFEIRKIGNLGKIYLW